MRNDPPRPFLPLLALFAGIIGWGACVDASGPAGGVVRLQVAPSFAALENPAADDHPALLVDNIRLRIGPPDGDALLDTIILWPADQDTLEIFVEFEAPSGVATFDFLLEARIGDLPVFVTEGQFSAGGAGDGTVLQPVLEYVGPGARAAVVELTAPATLAAGDTLALSAVVRDGDGGIIPDVALLWTVTDTAAGAVDADGVLTAGARLDLEIEVAARVPFTTVVDTVRLDVRAAGIAIGTDRDTLNAVGDTATLTVEARTVSGAPAAGGTFSWETPDSSLLELATVGATASAVAAATGTARVIALVDGHADTATIELRQVPATISLDPDSLELVAGDSARVTASAADSNGVAVPDPAFVWSSTDTLIAPVSDDGVASARLAGDAAIQVALGALASAVPVHVVPGPAAAVAIATPPPGFTAIADTVDLTATVVDAFSNFVAGGVAWATADSMVAAVDQDGRLRPWPTGRRR